jgi:V8-like Glu-specific endopeptidase
MRITIFLIILCIFRSVAVAQTSSVNSGNGQPPLSIFGQNSVLKGLDPALTSVAAFFYDGKTYTDTPRSAAINITTNKVDRIQQTTAFPWNTVGFLRIEDSAVQYTTCTGTMLAPRVVITAAHCFKDGQQGEFVLARNRTETPYPAVPIQRVMLLSEYEKQSFNNNFDLAFVILAQSPVRNTTGFVPVGVVEDTHFQASQTLPLLLLAAGYPTHPETSIEAGSLMLSATTTYRNSSLPDKSNQFEHKAFTEAGTSGGAIFALDPVYNQFALVGVISSQRTWQNGDAWAVGIKINPYAQARIAAVVRQIATQ